MLKNICLVITLVILFSACAFAQAKPLDPAKDYAIGPFKPGDAWNLPLAEKYFGKLVSETGVSIEPNSIMLNKDGIDANTPKTNNARTAQNFRFNGASFLVLDGKVRLITMTSAKLPTPRDFKVGDSYDKLLEIYPINEETKKILDGHLRNLDGEDCFVYFSSDTGSQRKYLTMFIDKRSRNVCGLALSIVDLSPNAAASSPADKPTPVAKPLDPAKDYAIGPFKAGDAWNRQLAEKYFGKLISEKGVSIEPNDILYNKDGIDAGTPKTNNVRTAQNFCFKDASFLVLDGKVRLFSTTSAKLQTPRGFKVGDSYDKLLEIYPINEETKKKLDGYLLEKDRESCFMYFSFDTDSQRTFLTIFIDSRSRSICGLVLSMVDLAPTAPKVVSSSPVAKPVPVAKPTPTASPTPKATPSAKPQPKVSALTDAYFASFSNVINRKGLVFLEFEAPWCPPSKEQKVIVNAVASKNSNIKFYRVNTDNAKAICAKYNIKTIPAMLVFKDGKEVDRMIGLHDEDAIMYKLAGFVAIGSSPAKNSLLTGDDFRIGPFKIGDKWDEDALKRAEEYFGKYYRKSDSSGITSKGENIYPIKFANATIEVTDNNIVGIYWSYGGGTFTTQRGLQMRDLIEKAVKLYGQPSVKDKYKYIYGNNKKGIKIVISDNNRISQISVYNRLDY